MDLRWYRKSRGPSLGLSLADWRALSPAQRVMLERALSRIERRIERQRLREAAQAQYQLRARLSGLVAQNPRREVA